MNRISPDQDMMDEIARAAAQQELDRVVASETAHLDRQAEAAAGDFDSADMAEQPTFKVVLASASPRRSELLKAAGVRFTVRIPAEPVDESLDSLDIDAKSEPAEACKKLAERKAGAVVQEILAQEDFTGMVIVIGADTMVVKGDTIFGKPVSLSDAKHMLRELSGCTHRVISAVSVWMISAPEPEKVSLGFRTFFDEALVTFRDLTDEEIADYLRKGESFDKAGAYAIQGEGADLVAKVEGSMETVIGLPVKKLIEQFPDLRTEL